MFPLSSVAFLVVHLDQVLMEWMGKEVRVTPEISERCAMPRAIFMNMIQIYVSKHLTRCTWIWSDHFCVPLQSNHLKKVLGTFFVFCQHRLNKFADNHRNAHVLGLAAIHGPQEKQALSELQSK